MPLAALIGPALTALGGASVLIPAAAAIGGGLIAAHGSSQAANTQANAAAAGQQSQLQMYQQTRSDLAPYMTTGNAAMSQLASLFGIGTGGPTAATAASATDALTKYPGYQFGVQQGQQALDRSAASKGLLLSGAQLKDAQRFGTDYAMQQAWNPYVSQLSAFANTGENAAAGVGTAGIKTGEDVAASQLLQGQATASGQVGTANALNSGIQSALLAYQLGHGGSVPFSQQTTPMNITPAQQLQVNGIY